MSKFTSILKKVVGGFVAIVVPFIVGLVWLAGGRYNTDFSPPPSQASVDQVFPKTIAEQERNIEQLSLDEGFTGFRASYGKSQDIQITVVQAPSPPLADTYFETAIVPQIDALPNHSRANVNGRWFGKGKDKAGGQWYGWVNRNWVFLMFGKDKKLFNQAIDEFQYISK